MDSKSIDACMLQETHLPGDFIMYLPKGQPMIHHSPKSQPNQGAKGGIAIILCPKMMESWKRGGIIIRQGGETAGETTRLLSVDIKIKTVVRAKTKSKFKHLRLTLMTSYHPTSRYLDKDASNFNQQVSTMLNLIPTKQLSS